MFYDNNKQDMLRFGDIVRGLILSHCHGYKPSRKEKPDAYQIEVNYPKYAAVLTPCCTIENRSGNTLVLSPLKKITPIYYFENSFLREDLTRINREMTIQEASGPEKWEKMSDDKKAEYLDKSPGKDYINLHEFVYEKHDLLEEYEIRYKDKQEAKTNYYVLDFRNIYKVQFDFSGTVSSTIKYLQLSIQAREELRDKLSNYFGRSPEQDIV